MNAMTDSDFKGLVSAALAALAGKASAVATADKAMTAVAIAAVNRCLFDKQLDRMDAACAAFRAYPADFALFTRKVLIFAGGFREEEGKFLDVRREPGVVPVLHLDAKGGKFVWHLPPKSPAGKATILAAAAAWKSIQDKASDIAFQKPKAKKALLTYADLLKSLKRFKDNEKDWSMADRLAIKAVLDKLSAELS